MNKAATKCLSALVILCLASTALAQVPAASACKPTGVLFGFFNGVQTTRVQADVALERLKKIHGETNAAGEKISYEVFYNYSNGFEDFVETFDQRLKEQDGLLQGRFELFFGAVHGGGDWWSDLTGAVAALEMVIEIGHDKHIDAAKRITSLHNDRNIQYFLALHSYNWNTY